MSENDYPLVSFGFVNCNRLHYLKSCIHSLEECTSDYPNKEFIVVDNHSIEEGTSEYLDELESRGFRVIRNDKRDPKNEFAKGLNTIVRESKGDFIIPLQGDMQFVLKGGWLKAYIDVYQKYKDNIGCIMLDAQRRVTIQGANFSKCEFINGMGFFVDYSRPPTCGAGDVMYSRRALEIMGPWSEDNLQHEYSGDSETDMLNRVKAMQGQKKIAWVQLMPSYPVAAAIYTDARGTNARVRGSKRYGDYWAPVGGINYYEYVEYSSVISNILPPTKPECIENVAKGIGWSVPIDSGGSWMKNPIRPEAATENDYIELPYTEDDYLQVQYEDVNEDVISWLDE